MLTSTSVIASILLYIWLGYFVEREQIGQLLLGYGLLFIFYLYLIKSNISINIAFVFRLILLFSFPALSDDFYRFVFDGRLLANGLNPYLILPSELIQTPDYQAIIGDKLIYEKLNSPNYYTVYPPLNQFIFIISAYLSNHNLLLNLIILRLFIIAADWGNIWLISRILKFQQNSPPNRGGVGGGAVYAFNPLVILELTGNLHFEAVMIFFGLLAVYLLIQKRYILSAISLACGVSIKLLPLIFILLIIKYLGFKKGIIYALIIGFLNLLLFAPFIDAQLIQNMGSSVGLYFQKFEFNASIYYLIRQIGYWVVGYNIIGSAGKILALLAFGGILWISFVKSKTVNNAYSLKTLLILTLYYALATTVHPWYITPLIVTSIFTNFRYPILWSAMVFLTYFSYTTKPYQENLYLVAIEYLLIFGLLIWEWKRYLKNA